MNWTSIHNHTTYSFLDGANRINVFVDRAKELGMTALSITDHNNLSGCFEFQKVCKDKGIKSLLGVEGYYTEDTNILSLDAKERTELAIKKAEQDGVIIPKKAKKKDIKKLIAPYEYDTKQYHILFLAMNQTGWNNLVKLQSEAAKKCTFNGRFCCDDNLLKKYNEGIVMTTACIGSIISHYINENETLKAEEKINKWHSIFGDRLYLEIQPILKQEQYMTNYNYIKWSKTKNINLIATSDVHYTFKEDWDDHDTLLCMGMGKLKSDTNRMKYDNDYWLKSYDEMIDCFEKQSIVMENLFGIDLFNINEYKINYIEALNNTNLIVNRIEDNIKLGSDKPLLPKTDVPQSMTPEQYLTIESYSNLYKYKKKNPNINLKQYEKRLNYELNIINNKGFAPYMLIVKDNIDYCASVDIPTGPGRGSAAGSLCLFLNNITKAVDPIKYNLLFERFLTPERTALPDIDSDYSYIGRPKFIKYLQNKYGAEYVSQIGTLTTEGVKSGIKDVARVFDIPFDEVNAITKKIDKISDEDPNTTFKSLDDLKNSPAERDKKAYKDFKELENQNKEIFRLARKFEGFNRNSGIHASGILVCACPVTDYFPVRYVDGMAVTLNTGTQVEELGGVKLDILGLKTLDVLDKTCKSIDKNMTVDELYEIVNDHLEDKEIFDMIKAKETDGIFQIESNLFKMLSDEIKPDSIHDIIAMNAIGRPGPLSSGANKHYAENKSNNIVIEPIPNTYDILKDTFGVIMYQEQIMQIAKRVAKVDNNQADKYFRKAISKKREDLMCLCRQFFIYGKKNEHAPEGYDYENKNQILYDPDCKYGAPILGGISNGYKEKDLVVFFESLKEYVSYLFNKSHAAAYGFIALCTGYLKKYYTSKYFAGLLTMQDKQEKIDKYIKVARKFNIKIKTPNINISNYDFTENNKEIYYGISSIKNIGAPSAKSIINNKPYDCMQDLFDKLDTKAFNKRTGEALICSGCLDFINNNRYELLNQFFQIRKDKKYEPLDIEEFNKDVCIKYETEYLGTPVTYLPYWDTLKTNESVYFPLELISVREHMQKNKKMMAFVKGKYQNCIIDAIAFASVYGKNISKFDIYRNKTIIVKGYKDANGSLIINKISK